MADGCHCKEVDENSDGDGMSLRVRLPSRLFVAKDMAGNTATQKDMAGKDTARLKKDMAGKKDMEGEKDMAGASTSTSKAKASKLKLNASSSLLHSNSNSNPMKLN